MLSRSLGDVGRGNLAAVLVPTQLAGWAIVVGVPYASAMMVRRHQRRELLDGAWAVALVVASPVCAALYLVAPVFLADRPPETVTWFRFGLIGTALAVPAATALHIRLITRGASAGLAATRSLHILTSSVLIVALAAAGRLTLVSALASWLGSYVAARFVVLAALNAWPRALATRRVVAEQLRVGRAHAVVSVATISLGRIDQVFLSFLEPSAELGVYAVAATAAQVSLPLARGFADVVMPDVFARPGADISRQAAFLIFAISAALGALSAFVAPWLIPWLFGEDFHRSVPLLWLLLPGQVLFNTAWVVSARHLGRGDASVAAISISVAAGLNLVLVGPAIAAFGAAGAALATSLCQAVFLAGVWAGREARGVRPSAC